MSGLSTQSLGSQAAPGYHDPPPPYYSAQPSQDTLAWIMENEHTRRVLLQRLDDMDEEFDIFCAEQRPTGVDYLQVAERCQEGGRILIEQGLIATDLAKVMRERANREWNDLYIALSKLTDSEFNQTYASFKQDPNQQIQHAVSELIEL
ncbi:uncharacterized protein N7496_005818 [Penicillium cataractarum]|uniref:Uncharacterized protein n=1 Tax=Penicillium cataractarum TaxID=2100454 RepID=A0A9W9S0L3_9EURO|nr:uncharacterized protein N7496_005818 [Penicillium cataractarum]KAJ5369726.1 hypothetical protein N7496_005818 [Penicillium cataractarum]